MTSQPVEPHAQALSYISDARFHHRFTLPANAEHDDLVISYADVGITPDSTSVDSSPPTILLMPGMFASRYIAVTMHTIAETLGVRMIVADRSGMGHSTDVPLHQRISTWLELVPLLLSHLNIKHVALMSHSAGALYLLNTLYHHRGILHPVKPFVALLAPWVDPMFSHVTSMQMAQYIPVKAFSIWHRIPRFFLLDAAPVFATSGTVVNKFSDFISFRGGADHEDTSEAETNRLRREKDYGLSRDFQAELDKLMFKSMFDESTVGANSEALQCLRKGSGWTWGKCDDYTTFVKDLAELERQRNGSAESDERRSKLKVSLYFADDDAMIGTAGQNYIEKCWKGENDGEFKDVLDLDTTTVAGVDHDSLTQSLDVLEKIFLDAGGLRPMAVH